MFNQVGRLTLAAALIALGLVLVTDNLLGSSFGWYLARMWPLLLVMLGAEWLWISARQGESQRVRMDGGAVVLLVIIAMVASASGPWWKAPWRWHRQYSYTAPSYAVPPIYLPPVHIPQVEIPLVEVPPVVVPPIHIPAISLPSFTIPSVTVGSQFSHERTLTHELPADLRSLTVDAVAASVTVVHGARASVELKVTGYGREQGEAERNAATVGLTVTGGSDPSVKAAGEGQLSPLSLAFRITVPDGVDLNLRTISGAITVIDAGGRVQLQSTSGAQRVTGVAEDLVATSSSGSVRAEAVGGAIRINTTSGAITIRQPAGPVTARSTSGAISLEAQQVGGSFDLSSISGAIRLTVPQSADMTVTASTSSGTISGPAWLGAASGGRSATGASGSGTHQARLQTTSGPISITAQ